MGREDTGELEAQVRGSRHAWDIRIISAEALLKLARLKENAADPETGKKIRSLLVPMEYTRLDPMIEVMFSTAQDIEPSLVGEVPTQDGQEEIEESAASTGQKGTWEFTDSVLLQKKREDIVAAVSKENSVPLIKKSRALFWSPDHHIRLVCTVSKRYTKPGAYKYWYAYHPEWNEFLNEGKFGYFVLGCMDLKIAFAIPHGELLQILPFLNTTTREDRTYWHVHIIEPNPEQYFILIPKKGDRLSLKSFEIAVP